MKTLDCLIVDDNESIADSLSSFFRAQGLAVRVEQSIDAAVGHLESEGVWIVLASATLPGGGGLELSRRVRALRGRRIEVYILSTTPPNARSRKEALAAGASGVIGKMSGPRGIHERVSAALENLRPGDAPPRPKERRKRRERSITNPALIRALASLKPRERGDEESAFDPFGADSLSARLAAPEPEGPPLSSAEEQFRLGMLFFRRNEYGSALPKFRQAWSMEAGEPKYLAYKARCEHLVAAKSPDPESDLADDLRMVIMLRPKLPEGHLFLGHLYAAARSKKAKQCFQTVLELDPGNAEARTALSMLR